LYAFQHGISRDFVVDIEATAAIVATTKKMEKTATNDSQSKENRTLSINTAKLAR